VIDEARKKQMAAPGLQAPAKKALATLDREWDGLAAHRGYPTRVSEFLREMTERLSRDTQVGPLPVTVSRPVCWSCR
jgi:hypothetical protein